MPVNVVLWVVKFFIHYFSNLRPLRQAAGICPWDFSMSRFWMTNSTHPQNHVFDLCFLLPVFKNYFKIKKNYHSPLDGSCQGKKSLGKHLTSVCQTENPLILNFPVMSLRCHHLGFPQAFLGAIQSGFNFPNWLCEMMYFLLFVLQTRFALNVAQNKKQMPYLIFLKRDVFYKEKRGPLRMSHGCVLKGWLGFHKVGKGDWPSAELSLPCPFTGGPSCPWKATFTLWQFSSDRRTHLWPPRVHEPRLGCLWVPLLVHLSDARSALPWVPPLLQPEAPWLKAHAVQENVILPPKSRPAQGVLPAALAAPILSSMSVWVAESVLWGQPESWST